MVSFPKGFHPLEQDLNRQVLAAADKCGLKLYLVGGFLRDALMGLYNSDNQPVDFDYAVAGGRAIDFARNFAAEVNGHFVPLDESLDTARVVVDSGHMFDFAGCVGGTIESDVKRRDFTVNALAWQPDQPDQVMDLVGALDDLETRTIRAIAAENFVDDPLRMLRAFRFSTTLGGTIEPATMTMIESKAYLLSNSAPERINYELFTIMRTQRAASALKAMGETDLLEVIFPELIDTRRVTPNAYHHLGLWDHSIEAVAQAEARVSELPSWVHQDLALQLSSGVTRLQALKVACLLHDIGKPETWQITPEGRHSFYGHDRVGADMCEILAERMRWSKPVSRFVVKLVRWHLRPGQLFHQGTPTERALHRFYRTIGQEVPSLMLLAFGDLGATRGPGLEGPQRQALENSLIELLENFPVFISGQKELERLLDGNDIMRLLEIDPGPVLGELLEALAEAQALKEVRNKAEAERFVLERYRSKSGQ